MGNKTFLLLIVLAVGVYPVFMLGYALSSLGPEQAELAEKAIVDYQISVWLAWMIYTGIAVYYKWNRKRNRFFYFTYGFLILAFGAYGYVFQDYFNTYGIDDGFRDSYTLGVLTALERIGMSALLTGMLQAAVWWFTRRWHRM